MDALQRLEAFLAVARLASFSRAGEQLEIAPSTVSRLVSDLERHLQVRLLQRTTRDVSLTPAGERYAVEAAPLVANLRRLDADIQSQTGQVSGRLRVIAQPDVANSLLVSALPGFMQAWPDLQVELTVAPVSIRKIARYDVALLIAGPRFDEDVVAWPLRVSPGILVASPDCIARYGLPRSVSELRGIPALLRPDSNDNGPLKPSRLHGPEGQIAEVALSSRLYTTHTPALLSACLAGLGVSAQTRISVEPYLKDGRLVEVLPDWTTGEFTVVAVSQSGRFVSQGVRQLIKHLRELGSRK